MKCLSISLWCVLFFIFHSQVSCSSSSPSSSSSSGPRCHVDESSALLQLKSSFSIATTPSHFCDYDYSDKKTTSWNETTDCCTWDGITCDGVTGHVIGLNLSCSWLQGTISSNSSLFFLRHLQRLDLSYNDFSGSPILPEFGQFKNMTHLALAFSKMSLGPATAKALARNLTNLRELQLRGVDMSLVPLLSLMNSSSSLTTLDLSSCELHGKFPEKVFQWPKLQVLYLSWNDALTGSFPKSNWSNSLRELDLSYTGFSVDTHLLKNARSLSHLSLSRCHFVGSYTTLFDNLTQIVSLDLSDNGFEGQIPWSSLNLNRLRSLDLSQNNLSGQIPEVIYAKYSTKNLSSSAASEYLLTSAPSSLTILSLSGNLLNGTLPSWIFALPYLTMLELGYNLFIGEIEEFQSTSLESLSLSQNKLHGPIPRSIFQNLNLRFLDLSSNNFTGRLELGLLSELKVLTYLELSSNNLSLSFNCSTNYTFDKLRYLGLSSSNISEFPSFLRYSKSLKALDLSRNQIKGSVPTWLWELGKDSLYYLDLSHNILTYIEPVLPWNNLQYLAIHSNFLSGPLPISFSPVLNILLASRNQFTGDIPSSFCNNTSLSVFDLSYNNLSGNIPSCFGNLNNSLSVLDLSYNNLSGYIPWYFGYGTRRLSVLDLRMNKFRGTISLAFAKECPLKTLNLNGNELEGSLPQSLLNCEMLEVLDVGNNKINGSFPRWLESLPELQVVILGSNRFSGSIGNPRIRFPFQKLRILDLSNNQFAGRLPTKYFENFVSMMNAHADHLEYIGVRPFYEDSVMVVLKGSGLQLEKILTTLATIDVSMNNFGGEIPMSIGKLKSLKGLNLSHNKLVGPIPISLRNLANLEGLDLSSNELFGEIPNELAADLTQLAFLNLSMNKLVGPIPRGKQFETFENNSYIGNLGLCGFPLSRTCSHEGATQPSSENVSKHEDDGIGWKIVLMGFGSGILIGISMAYMVLADKTIEWLADIVRVHWRTRRSSKRNARQVRRIGRRN